MNEVSVQVASVMVKAVVKVRAVAYTTYTWLAIVGGVIVYWGMEHQESSIMSVSARSANANDVIEAKLKYEVAWLVKVTAVIVIA
jgi:hypothetical protein